ncbi:MAG: SHOCT domain-containing protein [Clostridia bacterium]|nr:SHOCT domain-containing protein [Clostridia bacterium]
MDNGTNETIILNGVFKNVSNLFIIIYSFITVCLSALCIIVGRSVYNDNLRHYDTLWDIYYEYHAMNYNDLPHNQESYAMYSGDGFLGSPISLYCLSLIIPIVAIIILVVFIIARKQMKLTITDKRVYGKAGMIKRVDLPNDMISAIAAHFRSGVSFATSSGKIHFMFLENRKEVFKVISEILSSRQTKQEKTTQIIEQAALSDADELKKFKDLLDSGVITQEEFDAKKKQILGL